MAATFTLEQAAERLGISPEEFKRRLRDEWKSVRSFRDGPTLRFRAADIDELARTLGEASDPGIPLGHGVPLTDSSEEIPISMPSVKQSGPQSSIIRKAAPPPPKPPEPLLFTDDTDEDIFSVPTGDSGVGKKGPKKATGDSDVRLDLTPGKSSVSRAGAEVTEEISLDLPPPGLSGILKPGTSSAKLSNPKSSKLIGPESAKIPGPGSVAAGDDGSSEFELSLDSDSDSFELTLNPDSSEEVDLGGMDTRGKPAGDAAGMSGIQRSGIRLNQPADQGVSLERNIEDDSDIDFELTLDAPGPGASGIRSSSSLTGPKSAKKKPDDSDSEFELSLDDNSGVTDALVDDLNAEPNRGDIFETDFELPVVSDEESGSEVVAIESSDTDLENSDFDIAIEDSDAPMDDESASQVVLVDDDAMPMDDDAMVLSDEDAEPLASPSRKKKGLIAADDDDVMIGEEETDTGSSASKALRGVKGKPAGDEDETPIRSGVQPPARWGVIPALFLLPSLVVVVLGGLMMFEMIRGQWGYTQPSKPGDALVRGAAKTLDMKVTD